MRSKERWALTWLITRVNGFDSRSATKVEMAMKRFLISLFISVTLYMLAIPAHFISPSLSLGCLMAGSIGTMVFFFCGVYPLLSDD